MPKQAMMQRILSGLGCFGLVLLAILFALGVTEAIKYVSALERTTPVVMQGGPLPDDPEAFEETYCWPGTINPNEAITAIEGTVVKHRSFWSEGGKPKKERPFAGFPHDWNAIRIATGLIAKRIQYERLT